MKIEARFYLTRDEFTLDVEMRVPAQGISAISGPSGSGKTTLLRAFAGLEYCRDGYLALGDQIWQDTKRFVPTHQRPLGYVFQEANLFPHLSVQRNLEYGYKRLAEHDRQLALDQVVDLLGISTLLSRQPDSLSGGERQRVAIARALLTSPRLLLMDEPLAALDIKSKSEIYPFLDRLNRELAIPILYVSHSPDEVARLADQLVLMDKGKVLASGAIATMLTRLDLPLAHSTDAESIIEAKVISFDEAFHLTYLQFAGGQFTISGNDLGIGQSVRLRILARDVSLTLERQTDTSILNIFPVTVEELMEENPAQLTVRLNAQGATILSRITRKSATALGLDVGKEVYAQVKSVALLA
ncbi:molybdenum ABC transporter ATP-binding protein [Kaarinaea lacus]